MTLGAKESSGDTHIRVSEEVGLPNQISTLRKSAGK
jgi:hypothetical protein